MYLTYLNTATLDKFDEIEINYNTTVGHKTLEEVTQLADNDTPRFYAYENSMYCSLYIMFNVKNLLEGSNIITGAAYMVLGNYRSHSVIPLDTTDDRLTRDEFAQKYRLVLKKCLYENYRHTQMIPYFESLKE